MPGPVPAREAERRRRNVPEGGPIDQVDLADDPRFTEPVTAPPAESHWNDLAREWYESLASSGQSQFYEPSDWAFARFMAESMSRDLDEQPVGVSAEGEVQYAQIPLKGASLSAYLKGMTALMATEGDRRRMRLELQRGKAAEKGATEGTVVSFEEMMRRRNGTA